MNAAARASIAVIGGGPGGAQCARRLSELGLDVTLFEPRTRFEKPCGGGLPARALERFPFLDSPRLPAMRIGRCLTIAPSGREASFDLREPLLVVSRADLHELLLDRAVESGARLVRGRIVDFERISGGVDPTGRGRRFSWMLRCAAADGGAGHGPFSFLVAADGAAGFARRRLTGSANTRLLTQGIGLFLPGIVEDRITLKFYPRLEGYLWVFPRIDHSSAGICGPLGTPPAAALRGLMREFLVSRYGRAAVDGASGYAALIPGSLPGEDVLAGDGWAVAGDVGRAVDPLTREGIFYAMLSGQMLAECLAAGRPERYPALWRGTTAGEFARASRLASVFFDRRFIEALVVLCGRSPTIAATMSDLIGGRQPYRGLRRRLLAAAPSVGRECLLGPRGGGNARPTAA